MNERAFDAMNDLAIDHASRVFAQLRPEQTTEQALASLHVQALDAAIVYFYVVDGTGQLCGVVPTRRLLTAGRETPVSALMTDVSVTLSMTSTMADAAAALARHRLLAVPIVTALGRIEGVVDAAALGMDISAGLTGRQAEEWFGLLGVRVGGGRARAFRPRFGSLLWNVTGGLIAALVAGAHEQLLTAVAALALFMPVTLALSESIGMQAVAIGLGERPGTAGAGRLLDAIRSESSIAMRLAAGCAALVAGVAAIWQRDWHFTLTVFVAIAVAMTVAAVLGAVLPRVLHRLRTNPTVAAGPVVLALADFISLIVYFRVGTALLQSSP